MSRCLLVSIWGATWDLSIEWEWEWEWLESTKIDGDCQCDEARKGFGCITVSVMECLFYLSSSCTGIRSATNTQCFPPLSLLQWQGLKGRSKRELKAWMGLCLNDWRTIHQKKSWRRMWQQSQSGVHIATPPLVFGSCWMRAHSSSLSSSLLTHLRTWEGVGSASARCCLFHCVLLTHMPRLPQDTAVSSLSRFLRMGFRFIGAYEPKQRTWATESARMSSSAKGGLIFWGLKAPLYHCCLTIVIDNTGSSSLLWSIASSNGDRMGQTKSTRHLERRNPASWIMTNMLSLLFASSFMRR